MSGKKVSQSGEGEALNMARRIVRPGYAWSWIRFPEQPAPQSIKGVECAIQVKAMIDTGVNFKFAVSVWHGNNHEASRCHSFYGVREKRFRMMKVLEDLAQNHDVETRANLRASATKKIRA